MLTELETFLPESFRLQTLNEKVSCVNIYKSVIKMSHLLFTDDSAIYYVMCGQLTDKWKPKTEAENLKKMCVRTVLAVKNVYGVICINDFLLEVWSNTK